MRKLNQRWPKAVPIPRPPTPPCSVPHVQSLKRILLSSSNRNFNSESHTNSETSSWTSEVSSASSKTMSAGSVSVADNEPGDAIEPGPEFPPPPNEFLEDIRAFRKQEEIERPSPSPPTSSHVSGTTAFLLPRHMNVVRNGPAFSGNGSLNSSITETTESSCSPSVSPVSSPLPSPSHSSIDTSSTSSFAMNDKVAQPTMRFDFPDCSTSDRRVRNSSLPPRLTPGTRNVTLARLHPVSLSREPLYQRPPPPKGFGSLPRPSSSCSLGRPPDYLTAMQRLSLSKSAQPLGQKTAVVAPVRSLHPLKTPSHSSSLPTTFAYTNLSIRQSLSGHNRRSSISCGEVNGLGRSNQTVQPVAPNACPASFSPGKVKKRVSFSDQVELVAHSEDMNPEEHLPNPLLERVLGKAFLQSKNIENG